MGTVMIGIVVVMMGFMLYMHKDGMMMSHSNHGDHGAKTEESKNAPNENKAAPNKVDDEKAVPSKADETQPMEHKHVH